MKREIKFRAWSRENKIMVTCNQVPVGMLNKYDDPVMQFTGLKDKNGNEIYEGDIVHVGKDGQVWSVEYALFGEPRFGVFNQVNSCRDIELNGQEDDITGFYAVDEFIPLQVIGNIWENPELIK